MWVLGVPQGGNSLFGNTKSWQQRFDALKRQFDHTSAESLPQLLQIARRFVDELQQESNADSQVTHSHKRRYRSNYTWGISWLTNPQARQEWRKNIAPKIEETKAQLKLLKQATELTELYEGGLKGLVEIGYLCEDTATKLEIITRIRDHGPTRPNLLSATNFLKAHGETEAIKECAATIYYRLKNNDDDSFDLLDPLNPLSPISPLNPANPLDLY